MRRLLAVAIATILAVPAFAQTPVPGDIVINEIMYDPPTGGASNEWIEVVNRSGSTADLNGLVISDATSSSSAVQGPLILLPGEFAVLVRNEAEFQAAYPGVPYTVVTGFPSLNNSGDTVTISIGAPTHDSVPYLPSWGGTDASLERRDPDGPSADASNWATSTDPDFGTPNETNSVFEIDTTPPSLVEAVAESATLVRATFSEPLDAASAEEESNYFISDGMGQPAMAQVPSGNPSVVLLTLASPLPGLGTYTLTAMGVADPAGNAMGTETVSFGFGEGAVPSPGDIVINEFLYDEPTTDNPGEFIELFNRTDQTFDLSDFTLNDAVGDDEPITDQLILLEPDGYAVIVENAALFQALFPEVTFIEQDLWSALNNSGDAIVLKYEGTTIDSLAFTPSWGGEDASLERKDPRGPSTSASNWATTSDPRGGTPGAINTQFEPDLTGPVLDFASVLANEREIGAVFNETLDFSSITSSDFSIPGVQIIGARQADTPFPGTNARTVFLSLAERLPSGFYVLTATDIADPLGNTATSTAEFSFTADDIPPAISTASAFPPRTVRVLFTERVPSEIAGDPSIYSLGDLGSPTEIEIVRDPGIPESDANGADLLFPPNPPDRTVLTLTIVGLVDLAGNVQPETSAAVLFGDPDAPEIADIKITEIMFDPAAGSGGEYVEIVNATEDRIFDLQRTVLDDTPEGNDGITDDPFLLVPGQRLAIVSDLETFRVAFPEAPAIEASSFPGLGNGGDLVALLYRGAIIDSVRYDPEWHRVELEDATGVSLERRSPSLPSNDPNNWSSSLDPRGGTPGAENSISTLSEPPSGDRGLSFSPDPFDAGSGQGTTISYLLDAPASLVRVRIFDGAGRLVRELEGARLTGAEGSLIWDGRDDRGERLRIGPYVVLLEAVDTEGGTTEAYKGVVVLAREL